MPARYGSQPFREQVAFFQAKRPIPTARWDDIWQSAHDTGFMVAGAAKADLLNDLQSAVKKGIEGGSIGQFRKDFDAIVARHGWVGWTGSESAKRRAWRTRVIYETNLRSSYAAGRWEQIQANKDHLKYLEYKHSDSVRHPRPLHQSWDGLILPVDDPWWQTHAPPNGWGCKCRVVARSAGYLRRKGLTPGNPPDDGIDPKTGGPAGIDAGWAYAPGASRPRQLAAELRPKAQKLPRDVKAGLLRDLDAALARRGRTAPDLPVALAAKAPASKPYTAWLDQVVADAKPANTYKQVGTIGKTVAEAVRRRDVKLPDRRILLRDTEVLHILRDAKAKAETATGLRKSLSEADLRRLPEILGNPRAVLWDAQDKALIYVFDPAEREAGKIVVRVDYRTKLAGEGKRQINAVRTGGLLELSDLRVARYEILEGSL